MAYGSYQPRKVGGGQGFQLTNPYAPVAAVPTTGVAGTLTGSGPANYNSAVGGIPAVADPMEAVAKAIAEYTKQLPAMQALANQQTAANQAASLKQITDIDPSYLATMAQSGKNLLDWSEGKASDASTNALIQFMAETGRAMGVGPNSPNIATGLLTRYLSNAEAQQQRALEGINTLLSGIPRTTPTSISEFAISPGDLFQGLYGAQQLANLYAAAPVPVDAYNLAMANAQKGLNLGGAAGTGPFAGYSGAQGTTSGTNQAILDMLQRIISRPSTTSSTETSAYYNPTSTNWTQYGIPDIVSPNLNYGGEFDVVQPGANVVSPEEEFWNAVLYGE